MKTELMEKLTRNRDELWKAIEGVGEDHIASVPVIGEWTIKDAVGHISYWEGVIHDHVRESFAEGRPRPLREDEDEHIVNPREAAKRKDWSWARVQAEFENVRGELLREVERRSESELGLQVPVPWPGEDRFYSVGQMIEEDAIGHCRAHADQIRRWRASGQSQ